MGFFHAFYFVSFMGTTIGFGEIPYEFTDLQRAWVLVCIYTSVISWLYGIGSVLRLVQDETFLHAVVKRRFQNSIQGLDTPFYIICGYGETGEMVNRGLCQLGVQTVILDLDSERISSIELHDYTVAPVALTADITDPNNLIAAGINNHFCEGVIALTSMDHVNLQVAVASKLVNPSIKVISRSEIEDEAKNMASFGTNIIINPYLTVAQRLKQLTVNPGLHQIQNWFINQYSSERISEELADSGLPSGRWIICGYGRFGKAIHQAMQGAVDDMVIVSPDPIAARAPDGTITGRGTEADTLNEAGILDADVIVAATDDDANNLSILMTAKQIKADIVTVGRVNKEANKTLFSHANCHYIMRRSLVVANEALTAISRPLVTKFLRHSGTLSTDETAVLAQQIRRVARDSEPVTWRLVVDRSSSPDLVDLIKDGGSISIRKLTRGSRVNNGDCVPLLLLRNGVPEILPDEDKELSIGDQLLVCGARGSVLLPQRLQQNEELVDSIFNGNQHHIPLLRWMHRKKTRKSV